MPLITEALRGAGAVLRDLDGTPLMAGHDPRGDLAPRDVVAARMAEVIAAGTAGHVWLDATGLDPDVLEKGFPTVTAACRKHSIDPVTEYIPVAPGAHYSCGGILADLDGRTTIPGLYAVGEAASTGVQGANRLASNSVTEAVIAGRRAGQDLAAVLGRAIGAVTSAIDTTAVRSATPPTPIGADDGVTDWAEAGGGGRRRSEGGRQGSGGPQGDGGRQGSGGPQGDGGRQGGDGRQPDQGRQGDAGRSGEGGRRDGEGRTVGSRRRALAGAMSRWAGVSRDREGLGELVRVVGAGWETRGVGESPGSVRDEDLGVDLDLEAVEAANLRVVSGLIAAGALRRAESRGCHRRRDVPGTAERPWHTVLRWDGQELVVDEEEL